MTKPTGTSESPSIKTALIKSEEMAHQTEEGATSNSRKVKKTKGRVSHKRNGSNNTIRNNDKKIRERSISEYKLDGKYFSDSDSGYDSSHSGGIPSSGSILFLIMLEGKVKVKVELELRVILTPL